MNQIIKSFSIKGLFGSTDLFVPFGEDIKILIGENGLGKTQVLNMFYYTLTKRFDKLTDFVFDSITLEFSEDTVEVVHKDIQTHYYAQFEPFMQETISQIGISRFEELKELAGYDEFDPDLRYSSNSSYSRRIRQIAEHSPVSPNRIRDAVIFASRNQKKHHKKEKSLYNEYSAIIDKYLANYRVLYFPTYRRVEEDLRNLGYDEDRFGINREDARLIHFGMDDVEIRFTELTQKIEQLSREGLSKISSDILGQLVRGLPEPDNEFLNTIEQRDIEIILARVGDRITADEKTRIRDIVSVSTREIEAKDHSLLYFLKKLIEIYDRQRNFDDAIKTFRDVCNGYLVNKKIVYDESNIKIYVQADGSSEHLNLSKLSSGEKQIISIFARIYLPKDDCKFIVLFDEPELSLSIFWQRKLLPHMVDSGSCKFMLVVTHSPFIFENELDKYAVDLDQYLKPLVSVMS